MSSFIKVRSEPLTEQTLSEQINAYDRSDPQKGHFDKNSGASTDVNQPGHQCDSTFSESAPSDHRLAIERVIRTMRRRLSEDLRHEEMAEVALMSPYHFNRTFRRLTGIPPSQFLSALRLEEAKRLLLTTDTSATDICFEVGYQSLGTFTTRFTQLVGLAPGQFRRLGRAFTTNKDEVLSLSVPPPPTATDAVLVGSVMADEAMDGLIFMGLFETPIPQSRPVACAILPQAGDFRISIPGDGTFYLFAAGLASAKSPIDYLRHGGSVRGLAGAGPFTDTTTEPVQLRLRAPDLLDPPLLVTLPLLLDERLAEQFAVEEESLI